MNITDVKIRKIYSTGKMRGIVSITLDDVFAIHDIKIIESRSGYFIAMPSRKTAEGEFKDICHPITSELRNQLQAAILPVFEKELAESRQEEEEQE